MGWVGMIGHGEVDVSFLMNNIMKKSIVSILFILIGLTTIAQDPNSFIEFGRSEKKYFFMVNVSIIGNTLTEQTGVFRV